MLAKFPRIAHPDSGSVYSKKDSPCESFSIGPQGPPASRRNAPPVPFFLIAKQAQCRSAISREGVPPPRKMAPRPALREGYPVVKVDNKSKPLHNQHPARSRARGERGPDSRVRPLQVTVPRASVSFSPAKAGRQ